MSTGWIPGRPLRTDEAVDPTLARWNAINASLALKDTQHGAFLTVANWNTDSQALAACAPAGGGAASDDACFRAAPDQFQIRTNEAGKLATYIKAQVDALAGGVTPPPAAPGDPVPEPCAPANAIGIPAANPSPQAYGFDARGSLTAPSPRSGCSTPASTAATT